MTVETTNEWQNIMNIIHEPGFLCLIIRIRNFHMDYEETLNLRNIYLNKDSATDIEKNRLAEAFNLSSVTEAIVLRNPTDHELINAAMTKCHVNYDEGAHWFQVIAHYGKTYNAKFEPAFTGVDNCVIDCIRKYYNNMKPKYEKPFDMDKYSDYKDGVCWSDYEKISKICKYVIRVILPNGFAYNFGENIPEVNKKHVVQY